MIYAEKISFNKSTEQNLETIVRIKLITKEPNIWTIDEEPINGWYKKETINQWLHHKGADGFEIKVNINPNPKLIPVERNSTKYVRSNQDDTEKDNLLNLPICYEKETQ